MLYLKKFIALVISMSIITFSSASGEMLYSSDTGGCGYEECRRTPSLTPAIVLGTLALAAILAVALQQTHGGHAHFH